MGCPDDDGFSTYCAARAGTYQQFPVEEHLGFSLENFTAVDNFHCRAAAQTLDVQNKLCQHRGQGGKKNKKVRRVGTG